MLQPENTTANAISAVPELNEAEELGNSLRRLLIKSEKELVTGDARDHVERLERWVESYRRGLSAAQKISDNGMDMLKKTRDQLALALEELLRLEDEGGNPASKDQSKQVEELTAAVRRIDKLMPVIEKSFQVTPGEAESI